MERYSYAKLNFVKWLDVLFGLLINLIICEKRLQLNLLLFVPLHRNIIYTALIK